MDADLSEIIFKPIGVMRTGSKYKFEAPRQGVFSGSGGCIELLPPYRGEAVADLNGFDRIWVIFCFHHNLGTGWKSTVRPPLVPEPRRYSVFATRSPHRPNPIGISCVRLVKVASDRLWVDNVDILDGTPVLDIKPYIPQADAFPDAAAGWRENLELKHEAWSITYAEQFLAQAAYAVQLGAPDLVNFCEVQLRCNPLDRSRKRLFPVAAQPQKMEIGCRTWRILFAYDDAAKHIEVLAMRSNYTGAELAPEAEDIYADKDIHRKFIEKFKA